MWVVGLSNTDNTHAHTSTHTWQMNTYTHTHAYNTHTHTYTHTRTHAYNTHTIGSTCVWCDCRGKGGGLREEGRLTPYIAAAAAAEGDAEGVVVVSCSESRWVCSMLTSCMCVCVRMCVHMCVCVCLRCVFEVCA